MPWYFPWSDSLKKRACRYLLQHYLGHFLKEKLSLDQLSVNLYDGTGTIQDVLLDVVSLNEALENYNVPIEIVDGFVGSITVTIPWSALINDNTIVEIKNLELTIQPKQRPEAAGVVPGMMLDSMFSSMTTSMQLAQECLKQAQTEGEQLTESTQPLEGLELYAQTIEAVLTRIKVTFIDTIIRLEHLPKEAKTGAALEIHISRVEYFDEQATDQGSSVDTPSDVDAKSVYEPAAIAHKNFHLMGATLFCDEFLECQRTFSRCPSEACSPQSPKSGDLSASPDLSTGASIYRSATQDLPPAKGNTEPHSDPIKIAVFHGRQEIKLKVKQNEKLAGPKLELDCILGRVNIHLSPRQVHLLLEIANGLAAPGSCDDSNTRKKGTTNKPMSEMDYERVEHELQRQLQHERVGVQHERGHLYNWNDDTMTIQSLDDDGDDRYFDLGVSQSGLSSMESSATSVKSTSTTSTTSAFFNYGPGYARRESPFQATIPLSARKPKSPHKKDALPRLLDDPSAEVTRYHFKLSFLSVIVLHEDPPLTASDSLDHTTASQKLKVISEQYFSRALGISTTGMGTDLSKIRQQFTEACPYDHLGFLGKPLTMECNQKSTSVLQSTSLELTVGLAEIVECVFDRRGATHSHFSFSLPIQNVLPDYCPLLTFVYEVPDQKTPPMFSSMSASSSPCIRLKVSIVERTSSASRRSSFVPKTDIHLELSHCKSEVDITIIDRIHALLNPQPLTRTNSGGASLFKSQHPSIYQTRQACFSQVISENGGTEQKLDLHVSSPRVELILRFPIPDLQNEPRLRLPWWCRSLRKETLNLELIDADFQTTINSLEIGSKFELMWKEAEVFFHENPGEVPISFGKITTADSPGQQQDDGFNWPRLVVTLRPELHSVLEEDPEEVDDMTPQDSLNGACQFSKPPPSPFSSRKAMYDNEELVMPGDREETREFQEKAVANTQILVDIMVPNVDVILPSKDFFELLYNRINNDLLLWEPLAPAPLSQPEPQQLAPPWGLDMATQLLHPGVASDKFLMCKSGIQYDSSSDSEEEESGQFYSLHEAKQRQRRKQRQEQQNQQSKICINLTVGSGRLTAYAPLRNEEKKVRTDQQGQFLLDLRDGSMFMVVAHNGDPDLQYLCIHANKATLFHAGSVDILPSPPNIHQVPKTPPSHLLRTIYLSDPGVTTRLAGQVGKGIDTTDMLSIALRIKVDTFRNVKEFQVALGIRGGTLRHRTPQTGESWFTQLLDFFDVTDQHILGYTWPKIVTELHCHLWSCAIDYRPLYLPLRAMLTVETFSISSNIIAESPTSLLRFIVDDAALYISDKCSEASVDLRKNYVCVIDLGVFELSLRTSDGKDTRYPKLDLRASNNIVHVRTCSDTCSALAELIKYIASDADCAEEGDKDTASISSQMAPVSEESISDSPKLTQSHMEQVHDMMADAMKESVGSDSDSSHDGELIRAGGPTEVFFFPGEGNTGLAEVPGAHAMLPTTIHMQNLTLAMSESDDSVVCSMISTNMEPIEYYSPEEEFCIIDDPGLGIVPRDGEPKVRKLVDTVITLSDNHFAQPLGKSDQLKAPEHFPAAVSRYSLREMSLVWYMYGGQDFGSWQKSKTKRKTPSSAAGPKTPPPSMGKVGWQARGGPCRDIDTLMELQLNKVRLQHEVFPETAEQASRQILLINEVELRDRLMASKINKFLYQYTSEALPRQAHANMVVVKALHHRPDTGQPAQECSLKISLLPLRLNIDQDALFFLRNFFTSISDDSSEPAPAHGHDPPMSPAKAATAPPPVMSVGRSSSPTPADQEALLIMFDEIEHRNDEDEEDEFDDRESVEGAAKSQPIYFKSFVFSPDVPIRLDYHGKRVDMEQGTLAGLLVGLAQLNCSELRLKRINHRHGLLGVDRLALHVLNEWLQDLKKNQLPSILGGVGPMHSLVQLVQGIRDLFWLPVEQYRKDGRIVRGIQRGAHSFTTSTAMAALELTNRLVQTVQYAAEVAYDMVSPGPSVRNKRYYKRQRRAAQPADIREGVSNAVAVVKEGFSGTAANIAKVAIEEHELKGMTGAVGGILRQIPPTILQPVIIATEATSNVLGGMRNQLRPDRKQEDEDKWKPDEN